MFEVFVRADTNDADYVTSISDATQDDINRMLPIIEAIKANMDSHNWMKGDIASANEHFTAVYKDVIPVDELEWFDESFVPYGEYGTHTIETIEYYLTPSKTTLL